MLPPQLRQGLAPASRISTTAVRSSHRSSLAGTVLRPALSYTQTRNRWCWPHYRGEIWDSPLDPFYHRFTRYRTMKTRAKLLASIRRRSQWDSDVDGTFLTLSKSHPLMRHASHWNRPGDRWKRYGDGESGNKAAKDKEGVVEDELELSTREKRWRQQIEEMKKRIETDPYEALFGKRFEPSWSPLVPSWMREEMGLAGSPKPRQEIGNTATVVVKKEAPSTQSKTAEQIAKMEKKAQSWKPVAVPRNGRQAEPTTSKLEPVRHSSTTSWDFVSNKTRRVEWDSLSNVTKRLEYDPISNRMVQAEAPAAARIAAVEPATETNNEPKRPESADSGLKALQQIRKAIPIPLQLVLQPAPSAARAETKSITAHDVKATAFSRIPAKPAALAKLPKNDLDLLTADAVRASMGKIKHPATVTTPEVASQQKAQLERDFEDNIRARDPDIDAILEDRDLRKGRMYGHNLWNHIDLEFEFEGELEKLRKRKAQMEKDERGLFHVERRKKEIEKLDDRIERVTMQLAKLDEHYTAEHSKHYAAKIQAMTPASKTVTDSIASLRKQLDSQLETTLDRIHGQLKQTSGKLETSLDRTAPRTLRPKVDATEIAKSNSEARPNVTLNIPKGWEDQANLLQASRVERTHGKPKPKQVRWIDEMRARLEAKKSEFERKMKLQEGQDALRVEKLKNLQEKLDAEINATKRAMWAHENHLTHRLKASEPAAFQESVQAEKAEEPAVEPQMMDTQGEGDICANITKFVGTDKWYKQRAPHSTLKREREQQRELDNALVREVREIYEKKYGTITAEHRQPAIREVLEDTTVDQAVESALAEADKKQHYAFKNGDLASEVAAQERYAYESQPRVLHAAVDNSKNRSPALSEGPKVVYDDVPKLIPSVLGTTAEPSTSVKSEPPASSLQWEEPATYKVIAYDSGNDRISTVSTTSNFSDTEAPMSIPDALSHLYQPARFVPHFASLQSEGYQVIFATKDLLIFKKVKSGTAAVLKAEEPRRAKATVTKDTKLSPGETAVRDHSRSVNPVDGTSRQASELSTAVGNFASPTGFVNHDPVFPTEAPAPCKAQSTLSPSSAPPQEPALSQMYEADVDFVHYPRVRREERVFSGGRIRRDREHSRHESRRQHDGGIRKQKRRWRSKMRWALSVGASTAACVYVIGVAAEIARGEEKGRGGRQKRE